MSAKIANEYTSRLRALLSEERHTLVEFLLLLGEVDQKRLYLELGYASAWEFLRRALGQSERMTFYRLSAGRVLVRFPQTVALLREGRLCMTTLATLASVLTEANCERLIAEAMGKSSTEIMRIKARLTPKPVPKDVVQTMAPLALSRDEVAHTQQGPAEPPLTLRNVAPPETPMRAPASSETKPPDKTRILTETLTRRHMTTDREFEELLENVRFAYSHKLPGASDLDLLKAVMRTALARHEKGKGIVAHPRKPPEEQLPAKGKQAIPAQVRREVWMRDGGRCQWRTADGDVCGSALRVEFHHILDRGKGGLHTTENLMLCCATHNAYAADQVWGQAWMNRYRRAGPTAKVTPRERAPRAGRAPPDEINRPIGCEAMVAPIRRAAVGRAGRASRPQA